MPEKAIQTMTSQGRVAAFLAEPLQGVGGFIVPPKEYSKEIVGIIANMAGCLSVTKCRPPWGRTAARCSASTLGVHPDIMTFARAWPTACDRATIATPEVADSMRQHHFDLRRQSGHLHRGACDNPSDRRGNLVETRAVLGNRLRDGLNALKDKYPIIGDVRGMG